MAVIRKNAGNSGAEDRFIEIFCDTFGAEKGQYVYLQYPMVDIYGGHRSIDFALKMPDGRVAIEVDGNTWHEPGIVSQEKYHDDLLKQNSMVFEGWKVYRWTSAQIDRNPERIRDELVTFLGQNPLLQYIDDSMPVQYGKAIELMDHQEEALSSLAKMRETDSIALLYHATGTGKPSLRLQTQEILESGRFSLLTGVNWLSRQWVLSGSCGRRLLSGNMKAASKKRTLLLSAEAFRVFLRTWRILIRTNSGI